MTSSTSRECSVRDCTNPAPDGLQCGREDCARYRRGSQDSGNVKSNVNSPSSGGASSGEGPVEVVLPWDALCSVNDRQNPKSGFTLTRKYRQAMKRSRELAAMQHTGTPFSGPVAIRFDFYPPSKRPDIGNYTKNLKDALIGVAYEDDGQIRDERTVWMYIDKVEPRVEVSVTTINKAAA